MRQPSSPDLAGFVEGAVPPTVPGPIVVPGAGVGTGLGGRSVRGPTFPQPAKLPEAQAHEQGGHQDKGEEREAAGKG